MEKQTLLNSIKRSMQVSAAQVRCSLGRTSSVATREQALKQVQMLQQATKQEIDRMVAQKGFRDNGDGRGVNYIGERLHLEDMHPANVFIDSISDTPICIDCIVKFVRK